MDLCFRLCLTCHCFGDNRLYYSFATYDKDSVTAFLDRMEPQGWEDVQENCPFFLVFLSHKRSHSQHKTLHLFSDTHSQPLFPMRMLKHQWDYLRSGFTKNFPMIVSLNLGAVRIIWETVKKKKKKPCCAPPRSLQPKSLVVEPDSFVLTFPSYSKVIEPLP